MNPFSVEGRRSILAGLVVLVLFAMAAKGRPAAPRATSWTTASPLRSHGQERPSAAGAPPPPAATADGFGDPATLGDVG